MIERSDYGLISDQLYLMPFLRRYAAFLDLDGEEVAMRFVREVQRAEVRGGAADVRAARAARSQARALGTRGRGDNRALGDCRALRHRLRTPSRRIRRSISPRRRRRPPRCAGRRRACARSRARADDCARAHDCASTDGRAATAGRGSGADAQRPASSAAPTAPTAAASAAKDASLARDHAFRQRTPNSRLRDATRRATAPSGARCWRFLRR